MPRRGEARKRRVLVGRPADLNAHLTDPLWDAHHNQRSGLWELRDRTRLPFAL
jgi:hypothetical protein